MKGIISDALTRPRKHPELPGFAEGFARACQATMPGRSGAVEGDARIERAWSRDLRAARHPASFRLGARAPHDSRTTRLGESDEAPRAAASGRRSGRASRGGPRRRSRGRAGASSSGGPTAAWRTARRRSRPCGRPRARGRPPCSSERRSRAATWSLAQRTASTRPLPASPRANSGSSGSPTRTNAGGTDRPRSRIASRAPAIRALTVGAESRPDGEGQVAAAELQEVVGQPVAAGEVVDADEVELAPRRERAEVAVEQDDGDARRAQPLDQAAVDLLAAVDVLERGEEDAGHLAADELLAERLGVLDADVLARASAPPPPQSRP